MRFSSFKKVARVSFIVLTTIFLAAICTLRLRAGIVRQIYPHSRKTGLSLPDITKINVDSDLALTYSQCNYYFPDLFRDIDSAVKRGQFKPPVTSNHDFTKMTAQIHENRLFVRAYGGEDKRWHRGNAILHAIYRAMITSPATMPNVILPIMLGDYPSINSLSIAKTDAYLSEPGYVKNSWLMPNFQLFAHPETKAGPWLELRAKMRAADSISFDKKISKIVWRGNAHNNEIRLRLLSATKGESWADVQDVRWSNGDSLQSPIGDNNIMNLEEFCKYKFLVYTDGHSASSRLGYFTQCRSVIIAPGPNFTWQQHFTHLFIGSGPEQNIVFVKRDWSDLEETVQYLVENTAIAERIADNMVKLFRDRYLTLSADVCYWRKLIEGYAKVTSNGNTSYLPTSAVSFEDFAMMGKMYWKMNP